MGRKKIKDINKKRTINVYVPDEMLDYLDDVKNKSRFIEELLVEYFKKVK